MPWIKAPEGDDACSTSSLHTFEGPPCKFFPSGKDGRNVSCASVGPLLTLRNYTIHAQVEIYIDADCDNMLVSCIPVCPLMVSAVCSAHM